MRNPRSRTGFAIAAEKSVDRLSVQTTHRPADVAAAGPVFSYDDVEFAILVDVDRLHRVAARKFRLDVMSAKFHRPDRGAPLTDSTVEHAAAATSARVLNCMARSPQRKDGSRHYLRVEMG
jgi:hypothetical protein